MKILVLILISLISMLCQAQTRDPVSHTSSTVGGQARYEIVQSALAARWTFRLDRVCGNVSQVVLTKSETMTFENMLILGLPKCTSDGKIRYQLFTSGIAARHTYLLNTDTGKAWQVQILKDKEGNDFSAWVAFDD